MLQNQLIQERQQFEAWKASHAQPQPRTPQTQASQVVSLGHSEKVRLDGDIEVISVRLASAKRARLQEQATTSVAKHARSSASTSQIHLSPQGLP